MLDAHVHLIQPSERTSKPGISCRFKTKFRTFILKINESGKVTSTLNLNWEEINKDVETKFPPLRSFSSWEWHSQSNFFNTRSTNTALGILSKIFDFGYDKHEYFHDRLATLNVNFDNLSGLASDNSNIYLCIDREIIQPDATYLSDKRSTAFALVEIQKPILGG